MNPICDSSTALFLQTKASNRLTRSEPWNLVYQFVQLHEHYEVPSRCFELQTQICALKFRIWRQTLDLGGRTIVIIVFNLGSFGGQRNCRHNQPDRLILLVQKLKLKPKTKTRCGSRTKIASQSNHSMLSNPSIEIAPTEIQALNQLPNTFGNLSLKVLRHPKNNANHNFGLVIWQIRWSKF